MAEFYRGLVCSTEYKKAKRHTNRSSAWRVSDTEKGSESRKIPGRVARSSRKIIKHFTTYVIFLYLFHYET
jgi:hypothetical protein